MSALLLAVLGTAVVVGCAGDKAAGAGGGGGMRHGAGAENGSKKEEEAVPVRIATVERTSMSSLYSTSATLRASRQATVTTRSQGVIEHLAVEEGNRVEDGQVLAHLDADEQTITADRARATLETRKGEYERLQSLFEQDLVSKDEFEKAKREFRDAEHALDLAELDLSRTRIQAPFAGVIVRRYLDVGNTVTASTAVYDLADVTPLNADVNVPERHVARLEAGQAVRLVSDATSQSVEAIIDRIAPAVDPGTGTVKVTLAVEASDGLRPGTFVRVNIVTDTHGDTLVAPRAALVAEGRRWFIYRVGEDGTSAEKIEIDLGYESRDRVEILIMDETVELAAGDEVVVAGAGALEDGSMLDIMSDEGEAVAEVEEEIAVEDPDHEDDHDNDHEATP